VHDFAGHRSHEQAGQPGATVAAHDNLVAAELAGETHDGGCHVTLHDMGFHIHPGGDEQ